MRYYTLLHSRCSREVGTDGTSQMPGEEVSFQLLVKYLAAALVKRDEQKVPAADT